MKFADFVIPESLDEARAALKKLGDKGYPFAGGTAFQYLSDRPGLTAVDISRLGLGGIAKENGGFRIGATTTLTDLVRHHEEGWVLDRVATLIPTHQIRNISTVGGNIARLFPWSDLPLPLLVLDATIVVQGDTERTYSAQDFFEGRPSKLLAPGDLVTAVLLPAVKQPTGFGHRKETTTNAAFSLASAAASITLDGQTMNTVRLAVNAALPTPQRLTKVEEALAGQKADPLSFKDAVAAGVKDLPWQGREGMSNEFGQHMAEVVAQHVLEEALSSAKGELS